LDQSIAAFYNPLMAALRTPEGRFAGLPGFPWAPRYFEWRGLRAHYLDEGPSRPSGPARVLLALHGEPTWSYLYRRMIPAFLGAGYRVVAPDFVGFGRSDKPDDDAFYTFDMHRAFLLDLVERLDLRRITLAVQDWGGLLGLTLPMESPQRYERLLVMNTALGTGDAPLTEGFLAWRAYVARNPDLACGKLLARSCPHLSTGETAAYDAPFPDARYKAGVRRFPQLVPDRPDAPGAELSRRARDWWKSAWSGESFMAIGQKDPVLGEPVMRALRRTIRGCPEPYLHPEGGHFLQEWGENVARAALAHWGHA
jgi:pimeloyl-ACP methyl ester carboxylesterase